MTYLCPRWNSGFGHPWNSSLSFKFLPLAAEWGDWERNLIHGQKNKGKCVCVHVECLCTRAVPSATLSSGFYASSTDIIAGFSWLLILLYQTVKKKYFLIFLWLSESTNLGSLYLAWYSHRWVYFWERGSQEMRVNDSEILLWFDFLSFSLSVDLFHGERESRFRFPLLKREL